MCVIISLEAGQTVPFNMLKNAVHNNWHSYGLVTFKEDGPEVIKKCPEDEVDPIEVRDLLDDRIDYVRHLHLRHNTAGATSEENTHPFLVYDDGKGNKVWFMHNGTLYSYRSMKPGTGVNTFVQDDTGPSDTKNFADRILTPLLLNLTTGTVKADITQPFLRTMVWNAWKQAGGQNRGLLIHSNGSAWHFDDWKKIPLGDGHFLASNDDYFGYVKRGPEKERQEAAAKAFREKEQKAFEKRTQVIDNLSSFDISGKHPFFKIGSLVEVAKDVQEHGRQGLIDLAYATMDELRPIAEDTDAVVALLDYLLTDYALLNEELADVEERHTKATQLIASMKAPKKAA